MASLTPSNSDPRQIKVPHSRMERFKALVGSDVEIPLRLAKEQTNPVKTSSRIAPIPYIRPNEVLYEPHLSSQAVVKTGSAGITKSQYGAAPIPSQASDPEEASRLAAIVESSIMEHYQSVRPLGDLTAPGTLFCPVKAVEKYPYKYMDRNLGEKVSQAFFAGGKFWERDWTLYYLHTEPHFTGKPLVLVQSAEVLAFLAKINESLGSHLGLPDDPDENGFLVDFLDDGTPRPRFLGLSHSKAFYERLVAKIPVKDFKPTLEADITGETAGKPDQAALEEYKKRVEAAIDAQKNKSKAQRKKREEQRLNRVLSWGKQMRRAQSYLGLLAKTAGGFTNQDSKEPNPLAIVDPSSDIPSPYLTEPDGSNQTHLDVTLAAPFNFDQAVVFISIDCEAWEFNQKTITEIGVSTLDTQDLVGAPPGEGGKDWFPKIRSRHFRIIENDHHRNQKFVQGCTERFDFGKSEFIRLANAPATVGSCLRWPYSNPEFLDGYVSREQAASHETRKLVLVGHSTDADVAYLKSIGFDIGTNKNFVDVIDTARFHQFARRSRQPRGLRNVLHDLDISAWNLHNAGNDATYTLQAMIGLVFRHTEYPGGWKAEVEVPVVADGEPVVVGEEPLVAAVGEPVSS